MREGVQDMLTLLDNSSPLSGRGAIRLAVSVRYLESPCRVRSPSSSIAK